MAQLKDIRMDPLNGYLDTRSQSGTIDQAGFRLIMNMDGRESASYCRLGGWRKLGYDQECFLNQDLHDQMLCGQVYSLPQSYEVSGSTRFLGLAYGGCTTTIVPAYAQTTSLGEYCGYAEDSGFPTFTVTDIPFIGDQFIGFPYYEGPSPCTNSTNKVTWTLTMRSNAASWTAEKLSATVVWWSDAYGGEGTQTVEVPDASPVIQTIPLEFCIPSDAVNVRVISSIGIVHVALANTEVECDAAPVECDCTTGEPYHYRLSTYELNIRREFAENIIVECDGEGTPVYSTTPGSNVDYCKDIFLLGRQCREAITLLHSFRSVSGRRRLIAGTMSRLYVNNETGGNWRILADGLGGSCHDPSDCTCSPKRFTSAQLGNTVIFCNGIDPVLVWQSDEAPNGCYGWSADYLMDLLALNISTAEVCGVYQGFLFIGDVTADGERIPSRLHWCDYNNPLHWAPGFESLAGFHDFGQGETILVVKPIGGKIRIYTDRAIYDGTIVADDRLFSFQEVYRGERIPVYRHGFVNGGDFHMFMGEDTIYIMSEYDREPTPFEWCHLASGAVFRGLPSSWITAIDELDAFPPINDRNCNNIVGGWDGLNEAAWFSWPTGDDQCPSQSLILWPKRRKASLVDHGFTAFVTHQPDQDLQVRDFLASYGLCDPATGRLEKESVFCSEDYTPVNYPYLRNATEDPDLPMEPDSFFAQLCNICIEDICQTCDVPSTFIMACAEGQNLVEFTRDSYVREVYIEGESGPCVIPDPPPLPVIPTPGPDPDPEPDPEYVAPIYDPENEAGDPTASEPCELFEQVMYSNYVYGLIPGVDPNSEIPQAWAQCHEALLLSEVQQTWPHATRIGSFKWVYVATPANRRSANAKVGAGDCDSASGLNDVTVFFGGYVTLAAVFCV